MHSCFLWEMYAMREKKILKICQHMYNMTRHSITHKINIKKLNIENIQIFFLNIHLRKLKLSFCLFF